VGGGGGGRGKEKKEKKKKTRVGWEGCRRTRERGRRGLWALEVAAGGAVGVEAIVGRGRKPTAGGKDALPRREGRRW